MTDSPSRPLLHVIAGLSPGGAENFLLKLLQHDEVLRTHSAILSVRPQDELLPKFQALGVPVERQPLQADWRLPLRLWRIHRRIHAPGTRMVQSWLYLADCIASLSAQVLGRLPLAWGIRSSHGARGKRLTGLIAQRLNPWLSKRRVQRIVCCGERAREAHEALGYARDKLLVIPNGYDTRGQRRDADAGAALRAQLGIAPGAPVVGMAARIDTFKDHDTLLAAAALLAREFPDLRLLLCGKGTDGEGLRRRAQSLGLGDVLLGLGVRHDMQAVYSALDVHVLSSFTEGFPNVVAESALHGCVSFSTPVGEAPAMLDDARWLVPVGDAAAMARALGDCLRQSPAQRAAWAQAQREHIEQHYELARVAALYRQTYNQLVPDLLPTESP